MKWLSRLKKQSTPVPDTTEPTKPGYVGFAGTPDGYIQEIEADALAANDPAAGPDWWCWPHTDAMNTAEIDAFAARLGRFTGLGLDLAAAERLAHTLVIRDREEGDWAVCLECRHLRRGWRCGDWQRAGVAVRARDAEMAPEFVNRMQRCDGFTPAISLS